MSGKHPDTTPVFSEELMTLTSFDLRPVVPYRASEGNPLGKANSSFTTDK